ncbi:hypothetical protein QQF64_006507 [Cirrhinus molitorella]|uniref:CxC7-like cysteine cluster associated with KDZ transposases domain-containing protein n=1 Tax=Cirrhinus molitorella TaxID=172907 RepID=A0ABR3M7Z8_9TELE
MHATRPATGGAELEVTEERLEELLTNLKVDVCATPLQAVWPRPILYSKWICSATASDGQPAATARLMISRKGNYTDFRLLGMPKTFGVTNWSAFSSYYKAEFYKMYRLETCVQCGDTFKNCIPGYVGRGRRGELIKIISEDSHPGFCSEFCQICADLL